MDQALACHFAAATIDAGQHSNVRSYPSKATLFQAWMPVTEYLSFFVTAADLQGIIRTQKSSIENFIAIESSGFKTLRSYFERTRYAPLRDSPAI